MTPFRLFEYLFAGGAGVLADYFLILFGVLITTLLFGVFAPYYIEGRKALAAARKGSEPAIPAVPEIRGKGA